VRISQPARHRHVEQARHLSNKASGCSLGEGLMSRSRNALFTLEFIVMDVKN
jgi:hypothetical protein